MPMSRATARRDRLAPSVSRWRRAAALISSVISARTRARIDAAGMAKIIAHIRERRSCARRLACGRLALVNESIALITEHRAQRVPARTSDQEHTMAKHAIVGAGAVGSAAALLLAERGEQVRVVSRRGTGPQHPAIELIAADATDADRLTAITTGAAALYNCASPLYHQWFTDWPPLASALLIAAERSGAVLAAMSNLYGYGAIDGPITQKTPLAATHPKLRLRADMWREALALHEAGRIRAPQVRGSDYVEANSVLSTVIGKPLLAGERAYPASPPPVPDSWAPDPRPAAPRAQRGPARLRRA